MNNKPDEQMVLDLERHFAHRLSLEVHDIGTTCAHADIEIDVVLKLVMSGLLYELLRCAQTAGWDEAAFVHACRIAYRLMMPHILTEATHD